MGWFFFLWITCKMLVQMGGGGVHKLQNSQTPMEGCIKYSRHGYFDKIQGEFQEHLKKKPYLL